MKTCASSPMEEVVVQLGGHLGFAAGDLPHGAAKPQQRQAWRPA